MYQTGAIGYLLIFGGGIGLTIVLILNFRKKPISYHFFSIGLLIKSVGAILLGLLKTKLILFTPHLFLLAQPFQYLLGPACLYFVLYSLYPNRRFKRWEIIHLVPFFLHLGELIPFYLLGSAQKLEIIQDIYQSDGTIKLGLFGFSLDYFQHLLVKSFSTFCYTFSGFLILRKGFLSALDVYRIKNNTFYNWITIELSMKLIVELSFIIKSLWIGGNNYLDNLVTIALIADSIICFGFIILNPEILEGAKPFRFSFLPLAENKTTNVSENPIKDRSGDTLPQSSVSLPENIEKNFAIIENYFQIQKSFLREDFSKDDLSSKLNMPLRKVSSVIKSATGMSFPDYVNSYRIHYLEENFKKNKHWNNFTVDGIATDLGFSNRISFYHATRRHRNQTPSELLTTLGYKEGFS